MLVSTLRRTALSLIGSLVAVTAVTGSALAWDGWVEGRPDQLEQGAKGYFIWHAPNGWQLRTHDDSNGAVFSGRIHTDGIVRDVDLVRAESTEELHVTDGGHTIVFRFRTSDHIDGLNFAIQGGSFVRFSLETNGRQTALRHVYLGDDGQHPARNPFRLER